MKQRTFYYGLSLIFFIIMIVLLILMLKNRTDVLTVTTLGIAVFGALTTGIRLFLEKQKDKLSKN